MSDLSPELDRVGAACEPRDRRLLLVVLGYSSRRSAGLHPTCASRLARAAAEADGSEVILLSGWARHAGSHSEADLMSDAWPEPRGRLVIDRDARTTAHALARAATLARQHGFSEVRVVTSRWHMPRAVLMLRIVLRHSNTHISAAAAHGPPTVRQACREAVSWALVPIELRRRMRVERSH